ncbi:MAG: DUF4340 domain-containing protein [Desulfobacteraceae bacterium]|nr:DUF4340 domain-containing protein [Desulfobacteraceae bacterium]
MKKEYLILFVLILMLSAYLLLHKENKDNYTLPEIKKIDVSKITKIQLDRKQDPIVFSKKENVWILTDKEYLANVRFVENMLDTFKALKLTALVSQKGDLKRYELDDEKSIRIKLFEGSKNVFEFTMGKTAPTFNHTFVMIANDNIVYHANGSFRSSFEKSVNDFRDKKVMEFKEESIKQFTIEKEGLSKTLTSKQEKNDKETASITWTSDKGTSTDKEVISRLLSSLSSLECETYLDLAEKDKLKNQTPMCRVDLVSDADIKLTLYKTDTEDKLYGISSMNEYAFDLNPFNGKEMISNIEKLLGIEKEEEKQD